MKERYMLKCAVFLILTKKEENKEYVLLQQRFNTGILDGQYDVSVSGHLESGESIRNAMIRETKEEIGIDIKKEDLLYNSTIHAKFSDSEYIFVVFNSNKYVGNPEIMEKDKCSDLKWFDINNLPSTLADTRRIMINNYINNITYFEYGFKKED